MSKLNFPPFYVGQEVFALCDMSMEGIPIKKGQKFIVLENKYCCQWRIDIGSFSPRNSSILLFCASCKTPMEKLYLPSRHFSPAISNFKEIEYSKVLELEKEFINVN